MHTVLQSRGPLFGLLVLCTVLSGANCDDPTGPGGDPPTDYAVYFNDWRSTPENWFFIYHPHTNALDSILLPYSGPTFASPGGDLLYVTKPLHAGMAVLETDSFTVIQDLPYDHPKAVSPDGALLAVFDSGLVILRTTDYSILVHDTSLRDGVFGPDSRTFYGLPNSGHIRRIDLTDSLFAYTMLHVPMGAVGQLAVTPDESLVYLYLHRPYYQGVDFAVLDTRGDSLIFSEYLYPGIGELAMASDGRYAYFTNGHSGFDLTQAAQGGMESVVSLSVYDRRANGVTTRISTAGHLDASRPGGCPMTELCVTPDGRYAVALGSYTLGPYAITFDLRREVVAHYQRLSAWVYGRFLTCQTDR